MTVAGRWAQAPTARLRLRLARQGRAGLVLLPGLVCAVTGSVLLGGKSLGQDESVSATLARLGWHDLARVLFGREANMAVYHLLLKGWTAVFGAGESAVRSLSVLCAAGAASALFLLVARLLGRRTAVVSGILFGLNPVVLRLAQTARGYALCLLLVVAAELLLVVAVQRRSRSAWVGYAVVTACAVATNSLVVLLPAANLLALAALPRSAVRRRDLAGSTVLLSLLVAPLLLRVQQANADGVGWIAAGSVAVAAGRRGPRRVRRGRPARSLDDAAAAAVRARPAGELAGHADGRDGRPVDRLPAPAGPALPGLLPPAAGHPGGRGAAAPAPRCRRRRRLVLPRLRQAALRLLPLARPRRRRAGAPPSRGGPRRHR